jgi:DNA-binding XRE family transcriptional regulator
MSAVQIIRTPAGEELVVLPRADYDALVERADYDEDAADVAIYDARKAELAAGDAVLMPPQVSAAILRGQSRLKAVRLHCNVAQAEVAHKAGIGQGYLSDLENGRRAGTPETLAKIADALGAPIEWIS